MIYRVGSRHGDMMHWGYKYYTNKREAERAWREAYRDEHRDGTPLCTPHDEIEDPWGSEFDSIETLPLPRNKAEILAMLRLWASHSDNGP